MRHAVQHAFRNRRISPVAIQNVLLLFKVLQNICFKFGSGGHIHDFKNRDDGIVVINRMFPGNQSAKAAK